MQLKTKNSAILERRNVGGVVQVDSLQQGTARARPVETLFILSFIYCMPPFCRKGALRDLSCVFTGWWLSQVGAVRWWVVTVYHSHWSDPKRYCDLIGWNHHPIKTQLKSRKAPFWHQGGIQWIENEMRNVSTGRALAVPCCRLSSCTTPPTFQRY